MSTLRSLTGSLARLLIGVLVFAQLAVAAYACPDLRATALNGGAEPVVTSDGMVLESPVDCGAGGWHMDPAQPNLCAAHCQAADQNADAKPASTVPPALLASFWLLVSSTPRTQPARAAAAFDHPPAASPPLAILHCCFRF